MRNDMKRNKLISLVFALLLTGCTAQSRGDAAYQQISMKKAMEIMNSDTDYILLDVRTLEEYRTAHIPGAICIPNETIGADAPAELPDKAQMILVYCRSGNRSKRAAAKLAKLGYTNVLEFGGILDWTGETVSGQQ